MIRINKDPYPPDIRYSATGHDYYGQIKWRVVERAMLIDFRANPKLFNDGKYVFKKGYGYKEFRDALENCQGPKCCFCEKPIDGGQIEHFRPKAAWKQSKGAALVRPGYYWLAYRWENMLISCSECNSSGHKGNLFPIANIRGIAHSSCNAEIKTIINPAEEDPSQFLSFNLDIPIAVNGNQRGNDNIEIFNLRSRGDLASIRHDHLELYISQRDIASLKVPTGPFTKAKIDKAKKHLLTAQKPKQPFAGMIRENIRNGLI